VNVALNHRNSWQAEDIELLEELACAEARESFWAFRQYMRPKMKLGWWQRDCASHLQQFYADLVAGRKPVILLNAPPQHGKTETVTDFTAWLSGKNPDLRSIFCSYSDNLGVRVNGTLERMILSPQYQKVFPETQIAGIADSKTTRYKRNSKLLEFVDKEGSFRNTTVEGQINGQGLDVGLVDDPIKGRQEAMSKRIRDKTWDWLVDDFFARFAENAGMLMIMTRWHVDDPSGRWIDQFPNTKVLRYSAVAEKNEKHRKKGEALFPEHKSLEFLNMRRKAMTKSSWESIYQGSPIVVGGNLFPISEIKIIREINRRDVKKSIRYWDKAGTQDGGAYTAGVLMHRMTDDTYIVEDIRHGQWGALEREKRIKQTADSDSEFCRNYEVWIEQEPGSGGKESAENTVRKLSGYRVFPDRVTGDKEFRAEPFAAQVQGGNVSLVAGDWNQGYTDEMEEFPAGTRKDRVDASSGAFNKLALGSTYDTSMNWVG
jgi:predicted phage terminase large subunit-like protein